MTQSSGTDFKCEEEGFYPHPSDCKKYFWCLEAPGLGIVAHHFSCPSGLLFSKLSHKYLNSKFTTFSLARARRQGCWFVWLREKCLLHNKIGNNHEHHHNNRGTYNRESFVQQSKLDLQSAQPHHAENHDRLHSRRNRHLGPRAGRPESHKGADWADQESGRHWGARETN